MRRYRAFSEELSSRISRGRILDAGTGPGRLPIEIAKRSEAEVTGIDITFTLVEVANRIADRNGLSQRVRFVHGSAEDMPFEDGYFDFVVSTGSMHHWAKPASCTKEICRVLKEGGEAWIYDVCGWATSSKDVTSALRDRYGWLLSHLRQFSASRFHSMNKKEFDDILSSAHIGFREFSLEFGHIDPLFFRLQLKK